MNIWIFSPMVFVCLPRLRTGLLRVVLRVDADFERGGAMSDYKLTSERQGRLED